MATTERSLYHRQPPSPQGWGVIIRADFQKTAIGGGCLPWEVEPGDLRKALPKSER